MVLGGVEEGGVVSMFRDLGVAVAGVSVLSCVGSFLCVLGRQG